MSYYIDKITQYFNELVKELKIQCSSDIVYPSDSFSRVIGQQRAVQAMKQAIQNRRHVLLIGLAGTGKSLLAKCAMQIWPKSPLKIIACPNVNDTSKPILYQFTNNFNWEQYVKKHKANRITPATIFKVYLGISFLISLIASIYASDLILLTPCSIYMLLLMIAPHVGLSGVLNELIYGGASVNILAQGACIYDNTNEKTGNFIDVTGSNFRTVMGDVSHDPLAGLNINDPLNDKTTKLLRVGAVHKSHNGALYIDEIGSMDNDLQYALLTVLEQRVAGIKSGLHSGSSNTVQTLNKIPTEFCLILAGNPETTTKIHSALRSRIRGYGYEIVMNSSMPITKQNTRSLLHFIAREINENNYLAFDKHALVKLLYHAASLARLNNQYTLQLRAFKGILRLSSDFAKLHGHKTVTVDILNTNIRESKSIEHMLTTVGNKQFALNSEKGQIVAFLSRSSQGLTATEQVVSVFSNIEFYKTKFTGQQISFPLLNLYQQKHSAQNLHYINARNIGGRLSQYIKPQGYSLQIHFSNNKTLHRSILEPENIVFSIIGQYYLPDSNCVYIGEIQADDSINVSNKSIPLIDEALQLGCRVVTSYKLIDYYKSNPKVTYVQNITDLKLASNYELWS